MTQATLSQTLFIRIAPTIIVIILLIGGLAFYSADTEINTVYDAQLISNANVLWTLISDELNEAEEMVPNKVNDVDQKLADQLALNQRADDYAESRMFRIWKSGKIIMFSDTAPSSKMPKQKDGFSTKNYHGDEWRIYTLPIPNTAISIEVGEKTALRDTLVANILWNLAWPLCLLVPAIGAMIWFGIGSGLGAIRGLVSQIKSRTPHDLSPVDISLLPKDLSPLGFSLNQLFIKLDHSFSAEKRFTDHAAHQLRTPQAIIKLQLQMLSSASSEKEKKELLQELMISNERASKLVNMLLTSSRISHQQIDLQSLLVYPAIASVMAEIGVIAKEKNIEMELSGSEDVCVLADEALFKLMLSNLIENAVKYTPSGGRVWVNIDQHNTRCKLSIQDTGCGIAPQERTLVFERFYRVSTPTVEGSGLGLAMVADIIEKFSGSIELKTPQTGIGLLVEIMLQLYK